MSNVKTPAIVRGVKTPGQRGPFGRWLLQQRSARYRTQAEALDAMRRLAQLHIHPSEYAQWESGSRVPGDDNPKVQGLYAFFGSKPEVETATAPASSDAVAAAIDRQTAVLADLVRELREMREAQGGTTDALSQVLGALLPADATARLLQGDRT